MGIEHVGVAVAQLSTRSLRNAERRVQLYWAMTVLPLVVAMGNDYTIHSSALHFNIRKY